MAHLTASEQATLRFYQWEYRTRGYALFDGKVKIEPSFVPFQTTSFYQDGFEDDGKVPSLWRQISNTLFPSHKKVEKDSENLVEFLPTYDKHPPNLVGFSISFSRNTEISATISQEFLHVLSSTDFPVSFEILGTFKSIAIQFICQTKDRFRLESQLHAYFPDAIVKETFWGNLGFDFDKNIAICDFGLSEESMRPINMFSNYSFDPFTSIIATLDNLQEDERVLFQVIFQGVTSPWTIQMLRSVSDGRGGSFFADSPEMLSLAQEKVASLLFSVVLRVATQGNSDSKSNFLATELSDTIQTSFASPYNALIPLSNKGYSFDDHLYNLHHRTSNRWGFLLNSKELVGLVHYPNQNIVSEKLGTMGGKTRLVPSALVNQKYTLGLNIHKNKESIVGVSDQEKLRHIHVIGSTGVGKSTLLANMLLEDINLGNGGALFDPHGDIVEDVLARIPEHRKEDIILIDPSDFDFPVGFNLLHAETEAEKIVLSSDIVSAFQAHATAWGDTMTAVLSQAVNAFLESKQGGTLLELKRFLLEESFRNEFLKEVDDVSMHYYWKREYSMVSKRIAPLLTRIDTFLRPKVVRLMLAQQQGIDFKKCIEEKKILLIKLSQGLIGEENSYLLGSLFLSKIYQVAIGRQLLSKDERHPFYLYLDEFQNFITPSISSMLSGARKYGLGLTLAHQELMQISDSALLNSVISNPNVRICFRLGNSDAKRMEQGFEDFEASDLQALEVGEAIARVNGSKQDFNLKTYPIQSIDANSSENIRSYIIKNSRDLYAQPKEKVEALIQTMTPAFRGKKENEKESYSNDAVEAQKEKVHETSVAKSDRPETSSNKNLEEQKEAFLKQTEEVEQVKRHRSLQEMIKTLGLQYGFKTDIEKEISDSKKVDVSLSQGKLSIAVEISVTNTPEYELKNIQKCLDEGYSRIFMLSENASHLQKIEDLARCDVSKKKLSKVVFAHPNEFSRLLEEVIPNEKPKTKTIRGYQVKTNYSVSEDEKAQKKSLTDIIMGSLRKK